MQARVSGLSIVVGCLSNNIKCYGGGANPRVTLALSAILNLWVIYMCLHTYKYIIDIRWSCDVSYNQSFSSHLITIFCKSSVEVTTDGALGCPGSLCQSSRVGRLPVFVWGRTHSPDRDQLGNSVSLSCPSFPLPRGSCHWHVASQKSQKQHESEWNCFAFADLQLKTEHWC